jgi:molecular chaperone DnaK (HSP70)
MPYVLGVDVGRGHTTAAVLGHDDERAVVLPLDADATSVHSALYLTDDDMVLVGRDALARAEHEPERVARGLLDRVGDPVAPRLGGRPCPAEVLMAALVAWVMDRAVESEGDLPRRVAVTHPAGWGPHRRGLLGAALRQAGVPDVLLLPKPVAAAESFAETNPVPDGEPVAVYDLGQHGLACGVARSGPSGFTLLSHSETAEQLGGTRFDDLLTAHVLAELDVYPADLDPFDDGVRAAMAELRAACRGAKETLSATGKVTVPTALFGRPAGVPVTRARLAELIAPVVHRGIDVLTRTVRAAGRPVEVLTMVGGSARIPLIVELVTAAAPGSVVVDLDPTTAAARGAAVAGARQDAERDTPQASVQVPEQRDEAAPYDPDAPTQPPRPPVAVAPLDVPRRWSRWKPPGRARRRAS